MTAKPQTMLEVIIELLCFEGMDYEDAVEHFEYNVKGSYMGEKTPIWVFNYF